MNYKSAHNKVLHRRQFRLASAFAAFIDRMGDDQQVPCPGNAREGLALLTKTANPF